MTKYVIRATATGMYLAQGPNLRWVEDIQTAHRFDFMFVAMHFATMRLDYSPSQYTVEAVV